MPPKKVLVDGYNMGMPRGTGIATYARGLATAARAAGAEVEILVAATPRLAESGANFAERWSRQGRSGAVADFMRGAARIVAGRGRVTAAPLALDDFAGGRPLRERLPAHDQTWAFPHLFALAGLYYRFTGRFLEIVVPSQPDVAHWTYTMPLRVVGAKNVYTIHDLVPLIMPDAVRMDRRLFREISSRIAARADHILTVSENSKRDIVRLLDAPASRISNAYQAVDMPASAIDASTERAREAVEMERGLPFGDYFLYFGAIEPKKNVARLIQGYLQSGVACPLVIVGKFGWKFKSEASFLRDPALRYATSPGAKPEARRGLKQFDHLDRTSLAALIRGAKAVLFPSLYEGFGLPALEAMLVGAPVLASTMGALPEVCGDGALLVDPYDVDAIALGIRRLYDEPDLRRTLSERGQRQAERFSPSAYAARMAAFYEKLDATAAAEPPLNLDPVRSADRLA